MLHNEYLKLGGEDTVVANEMNILQKEGYTVFYRAYNNRIYDQGNRISRLISGFNFFFNISAFFSIYRFIKKHRIDVVHVHNLFYTLSPSVFWAAKLAGARTIMTIHNYRLFCLNGVFFRNGGNCMDCVTQKSFRSGIRYKCFKSSSLFSRVLASATVLHRRAGTWKNKVDCFIALNPLMKELLVGIGIEELKICIKPNFVTDRESKNYDERGDFYLFAARLQEDKGVRHVVEAFNKSGKKLIIAGEGELVPFIKANADPNIQYIGQQSREQMTFLLQKCRGFIFASVVPEGMPMTIIEAQSVGAIPIVGKSVNTKRMISDGDDGFLYETGRCSFPQPAASAY